MEQCTQHGEFTKKTDQILSDVSEIKGAIIGSIDGKKGLITKIDDLETRVEVLETIKNKILDKVLDLVFKSAGTIAMGYATLHISGIIK